LKNATVAARGRRMQVNQERLLHRAYLTVDYACDVSVTEEDMKIIANRKEG